jgi:hypothetical protein
MYSGLGNELAENFVLNLSLTPMLQQDNRERINHTPCSFRLLYERFRDDLLMICVKLLDRQ